MKQIKIITSVERTPVENLHGMARVSKTSVLPPSGISWHHIKTKPHAQLVISDKVEGRNTVWTAKLIFKTCETLEENNRFAYRCRLTNGQYRLIGTDERPYPMASVVENMPENITDNQLNEVTVNWQSPRFIPVITE